MSEADVRARQRGEYEPEILAEPIGGPLTEDDEAKRAAGHDGDEDTAADGVDPVGGHDAAKRDRELALLGVTRAAGHDVTPGHDRLHHYWTRDPKGREQWVHAEHPFMTLVGLLVEHAHVTPERAKTWANVWYHEVFGYYPGSDVARLKHGKPPRGNRVGPG